MLAIPLFAIIVKIQVGTATQTMIQHQNLALNANRSKLWLLTVQYMKSKALERDGEADMVKCCVQTDRIKDLIPALFFIYIVTYCGDLIN